MATLAPASASLTLTGGSPVRMITMRPASAALALAGVSPIRKHRLDPPAAGSIVATGAQPVLITTLNLRTGLLTIGVYSGAQAVGANAPPHRSVTLRPRSTIISTNPLNSACAVRDIATGAALTLSADSATARDAALSGRAGVADSLAADRDAALAALDAALSN